MTYAEFLERKQRRAEHHGRDIALTDVHPMLHHWQAEIVQWAVKTGRAAVWADTSNQMLKLAGNGVVPQQAIAAFEHLLAADLGAAA